MSLRTAKLLTLDQLRNLARNLRVEVVMTAHSSAISSHVTAAEAIALLDRPALTKPLSHEGKNLWARSSRDARCAGT